MNETFKNEFKPIILISGATATGKTSLSITIAKELKEKGITSEVINADSLLFYKEINIGTAKPTIDERQDIPHHLIDCTSITNPLNANDYCDLAIPIISNLHAKKSIPIIVGGSAFYIRALLKGMYEAGAPNKEAEAKLKEIENSGGWMAIRNFLKDVDSASYERIHENDRYRTLRALEHFLTHHSKFSTLKNKMDEAKPYDFSQLRDPSWSLHHIYLEIPKNEHWEIMEKRAKSMISSGLLEEVRNILSQSFKRDLKPLQSIGYKECIQFINDNREATPLLLLNLVEEIYINTRKLAKSQKTFFKKISPKLTYNPMNESEMILQDFLTFLNQVKI
ncbi:MAG: tRNA (adenosine(37)-N6)-dimethylallyltransferase MiaA [Bacteriovoracaceae bacterium]|nr:tRNA (adenosine(37)-N6)-dimethylallyltransferase MiaA [Bacteriovoracaceae bacterium]